MTDIGSAFEKVRRHGMPEGMSGNSFVDTGLCHVAGNEFRKDGPVEPPAFVRNEEIGDLLRAKKFWAAKLDVVLDGVARGGGQRNVSVFSSFSLVDAKRSILDVHIPRREIGELGRSQAGGIEELEDGPVSKAAR